MFDFEGINDTAYNESFEELEQLRDIVGETKVSGFENISDLNNEIIADYLKDYIPIEHLNGCPEIKYDPENSFFKDYPSVLGIFNTRTKQIEIASEERFEKVNDILDTVVHEVGHNVYSVLERSFPQAAGRWNEMYIESLENNFTGYGFVSEYAKTNQYEDFAESYKTYVTDPDLLKFMSPGKYEFLKFNVFSGREYAQVQLTDGQHMTMEKSIANTLAGALEGVDGIQDEKADEMIEISDFTMPISDTYRCFSMIA